MRHKTIPTALQSNLLPQIVAYIREAELTEGTPLREVELSRRLQVSRTPVRWALAHLATRGIVRSGGRGYVVGSLDTPDLAKQAALLEDAAAPDELDRISLQITTDRLSGLLQAEVFEADLMRRYDASRQILQRVLTKLAGLGVVERRQGRGWTFRPAIADPVTRMESFRWRITIEPAALIEPGFKVTDEWIGAMRERHLTMLAKPWRDIASVAFFELNVEFHEGLAAGAKNRFLLQAVQQQNQLRRMHNYSWAFTSELSRVKKRVEVNLRQHLEMLDKIEAGELEVASVLMRRHLELAYEVRAPEDWSNIKPDQSPMDGEII